MKITSSAVQMATQHSQFQEYRQQTSLRTWQTPPTNPTGLQVSLSEAAQSAASAPPNKDDSPTLDPRLSLIKEMVERLTGRPIRLLHLPQGQQESSPVTSSGSVTEVTPKDAASFGLDYQHHEHYAEQEYSRFTANGVIHTADGREINFTLQLEMQRRLSIDSETQLQIGEAARKTDPLVINYSGKAAELTDQAFSFDLNGDGRSESIHELATGSAYLAFDRNGNGRIDNGTELFGPSSNDGFSELAALDEDRNGWIDENDPAFTKLSLWSGTQSGQTRKLTEAGIGALMLSHVSTPFSIRSSSNQTLAEVRQSGLFLHENGTTGTIQQIDLIA